MSTSDRETKESGGEVVSDSRVLSLIVAHCKSDRKTNKLDREASGNEHVR